MLGRRARFAPRKGQACAGRFEDTDNDRLVGGQQYVLRFSSAPPAEIFCSVVIYDVESRTLTVNETQNATIGSQATPDLQTNSDGSIYVYVGPTPPPVKESNWVHSVPGHGWFPYIRMYGPGEHWFNEDAYALPQVETTNW